MIITGLLKRADTPLCLWSLDCITHHTEAQAQQNQNTASPPLPGPHAPSHIHFSISLTMPRPTQRPPAFCAASDLARKADVTPPPNSQQFVSTFGNPEVQEQPWQYHHDNCPLTHSFLPTKPHTPYVGGTQRCEASLQGRQPPSHTTSISPSTCQGLSPAPLPSVRPASQQRKTR